MLSASLNNTFPSIPTTDTERSLCVVGFVCLEVIALWKHDLKYIWNSLIHMGFFSSSLLTTVFFTFAVFDLHFVVEALYKCIFNVK